MDKYLNSLEMKLLDNMLSEARMHKHAPRFIKKEIVAQLNSNPVTSKWRFIKQYKALAYLKLV